jgi:mRNA interferase RelE/StbE
MDYEVLLMPSAARDLRKLSPEIRPRLEQALISLKEPRQTGAKKLQGSDDRWRIRVGDYRIIYRIADGDKQVIVSRIAHRREVYRLS